MARKLALIIGNSQYEDAGLARLAAPDVDVRTLAEVLHAPGVGGFDEVTPLLNEGLATVRKAIARFFDAKHRDDLLLLYFSGHGVRDEQGHLYLAVRDTERAVLAGTAIEASYVTTRMDRSASKRLVLVLDCCHSGAFGVGSKSAQGATVGTASAFEGTGRGRVVLTATDSTQFAWEGDQVIGDVENSLFTHYLIEGLRTGAADRDEDGQITIDELYDYVYDHVLNDTPKQTPGKWAFGQQGEIVIAQNPGVTVARLPPELEEALKSTLPSVRFQILPELYSIVRGRHEGRASAAREAMQRLAADDSRKVATGAGIYLQALDGNEALTEDEWVQRSREREDELSGRKTVAAQIESYVEAATASLERGALDDVRELLGRAMRLDPKAVLALRLQERLDDALAERARLEDAERRIREIRKNIAALIARANATSAHADAIALLNEALGLDPEDAEVRQLLETRHRQVQEAEAADRVRREKETEAAALVQAELERRARLEGQLAEASRHLSRENLTKAIVISEAVLRADPDNAAAREILARAQGGIEAKRLADEQAAQARDKRRHLEDMIAAAEAATSHDSAIEILEAALVDDPGNWRIQRLLARRQLDAKEARTAKATAAAAMSAEATRERPAIDSVRPVPSGFSAEPTVAANTWKWDLGGALRSQTFKIASVLLIAGALTWNVLDRKQEPRTVKPPPQSTTPSVGTHPTTQPTTQPSSPVDPTPVAPTPSVAKPDTPPIGTSTAETGKSDPGKVNDGARGRRGASAVGRANVVPPKNQTPERKADPQPPITTPPSATPSVPPPVTTPQPSAAGTVIGAGEKPSVEEPLPGRREPPTTPAGTGRSPASGTEDPPATKAAVADEASLRLAVEAYERAMSSGNREAVKRVFPGVSDSELKEIDGLKVNFGREYRMNVFIRDVKITGTRARVDSRIVHNGIDDRGKTVSNARNETLLFEWNGGTWVRVR